MECSKILIRYGELSTKGKNKMEFVRMLERNIKHLVGINPDVSFDRMFIPYSENNLQGLQFVFGIQSYSPVWEVSSKQEEISQLVLKIVNQVKTSSFRISVKRSWKGFPFSSMDFAAQLGGLVQEVTGMKVDLHSPALHLEVEIREKSTYLFIQRINGLGGYPTGINGKVLHLISGGIDSPVAALKMMKRGVHVDFLNFITPPHTDQRTVDKVNRIVKLLCQYQGKAVIYRNTYTDLMNLLGLTSNQAYKITLMRRSFYRLASRLAKEKGYLAISNGDNLGQVASQTLESMDVIGCQSDLPILRPLLTADKLETIAEGIKIGTYPISIEPAAESCEIFAPIAPVIKPKKVVAENLEQELEVLFEMEEKNFQNCFEIQHW